MAAPVAALQSSQPRAGRPKTPAGHRVLRGDAVGGLGLRQHGVLRGCAQHGAGRRQPVAVGMWCRWDESPVTGARLPASLTPRLLQGPAAGASCTGSGTGPPLSSQRCSRAQSHGPTLARSTARPHTAGTGEQEGTAAPKPYRSHLCVRQKPAYGLLPGRRRNDFVSSAVLQALRVPQLTINNKPRASRSQPRSQQLSRCFLSASQLSIRYMCIYEIL